MNLDTIIVKRNKYYVKEMYFRSGRSRAYIYSGKQISTKTLAAFIERKRYDIYWTECSNLCEARSVVQKVTGIQGNRNGVYSKETNPVQVKGGSRCKSK